MQRGDYVRVVGVQYWSMPGWAPQPLSRFRHAQVLIEAAKASIHRYVDMLGGYR